MVTRLFTRLFAGAQCGCSRWATRSLQSRASTRLYSQQSLHKHPAQSRWPRQHILNGSRGPHSSFNGFQRRNHGIYRALVRTNFTLLWATSPEFRRFVYILGGTALCFAAYSTERVPLTGRWRFNCVPAFALERLGETVVREKLEELGDAVLPQSAPEVQRLQRVLDRLLSSSRSLRDTTADLSWNIHVIESDIVNATLHPGRHILVYTGILPCLWDANGHDEDDKAAALLAHELAHHVARHAGESVSSYLALIVTTWLATFVFNVSSQSTYDTLETAYSLRNSRTQESEADRLGILFMAMAGYDPRGAVAFLENMSQASGVQTSDRWSTHPNVPTRIKQIQAGMDEALRLRDRSRCETSVCASH